MPVTSSHIGFSGFLGRFFNQTVVSPYKFFNVPIDADSIVIELDFYEIDGWKNATTDYRECGLSTDCVFVYVGSHKIPVGIFGSERDEGSYDGYVNGIYWIVESITAPTDLGYGSQMDQKHKITITIPKKSEVYDGGRLKLELETLATSGGLSSGLGQCDC
jgi:hypothetical protein